MNNDIKKFIEDHIELIEDNKWKEIYNKNFPTGLTEALLESGINPLLQGLNYLPKWFLYKSNIKEFQIPNNVSSIGHNAFEGCTSLTNIEIPNSVTDIRHYAFSSCDSLTKIDYLGTIGQWVQIKFDGSAANPLTQGARLYIGGQLVNELVIPNNVIKISAYAFYNCKSLTSIVIGNNVTSIGEAAFYKCISLKSVTIPYSVKSIGESAFYNCTNLKEIKYLGTKREAMQLGIRDRSNTKWAWGSSISKIICTDGEILL